jgi:superoxide dismutase, Cu-Zn family
VFGLLVAVAVGGPGCKKEQKAPEQGAAEPAPAGETPPPGEAPPADPGAAPAGEAPAAAAGGDAAAGQPAAGEPAAGEPAAGGGGSAVAEMKAASGSKVAGTVTFTDKNGKVEVAVDLSGLTPGEHGFHIHEKGDCSSPDAKSAGDHFNPDKKEHGAPDAPAHHAGDLGNLTAGEDGTVKTSTTVDFLTLGDQPNSAVGKAVIVHEKKDDMKTQPTGNAGGRVACGVVEKK